jgi:hydrogenase maturation protease
MKPVLVLGIGNTLRSDDGAGVRAVELIDTRNYDVDVETVHQLTPDLAERIHHYGHLIIVDASVHATEVTLTRLEGATTGTSIRSHESSPADLLTLCRTLYGEGPENVMLLEIPAYSFAYGESLSPRALRGVKEAADLAGTYLSGLDL